MPSRRSTSMSLKATRVGARREGRPDMRDHSKFNRNGGPRPSRDFDWDAALLAFALTVWSLGYTLTREQKQRIEDYGNS